MQLIMNLINPKKVILHIYRLFSFTKVRKKKKFVSDYNSTIVDSEISQNVLIGEGCIIHRSVLAGNITVGKNTSINGPNTDIYAYKGTVKIGNFCSIARNVSIQTYDHYHNRISTYFIKHHIFKENWLDEITTKGDVIIGNDVWIGTHCVILSGVTIGDGAIIAANSVVNSDIPPYAIAAGSPAVVKKFRFNSDIISELNIIKWWDWPIEKIENNYNLFSGVLTMEKLKNIN